MTDAFYIYKGDTIIARVDQGDFGQRAVEEIGIRKPRVEQIVKFIVDACNTKGINK